MEDRYMWEVGRKDRQEKLRENYNSEYHLG
jgi:hypothetical protein